MAERFKGQVWFTTLKLLTTNGVTYEKGHMVFQDTTTNLAVVAAGTTNVPVGHVLHDTVVGTGANFVHVELPEPIRCHTYNINGANPVTSANLFETVYFSASDEVSSLSTGRSAAGRLIALENGKALVKETAL